MSGGPRSGAQGTSGGPARSGAALLRDRNLQIIFAITLVALMGVSSVTPAFHTVRVALGLTSQGVGLLITVFSVPGVFLAPLMGLLADRVGRRKVLVPSLLLFGFAGGACSLVADFDQLLVLRFLQGVGASALGALNFTLIGDIFTGRERVTAMGYNASVAAMAAAGLPAIGGLLAAVDWAYPFALSFVGVPVALLVALALDNPEPKADTGIGTYLRGLTHSLRDRRLVGIFGAGLSSFIVLYGVLLVYVTLYMGQEFAASEPVIGLLMAALGGVSALVSIQFGALGDRISPPSLLILSFFLGAVGVAALPFAPTLWWLLGPMVIYGASLGIMFPAVQLLLTEMAPIERRTTFMSINAMLFRAGQAIGPLVAGVGFALGGMDAVFFGGAGLLLVTGVLVAGTFR